MFTMKKGFLASVVGLALAWATPAAADAIAFDPTGAGPGGSLNIDTFDQSAGNSLAIDITVHNIAIGDTFTALYQANLANALLASTVQVPGDGSGNAAGNFFTFTGTFSQIVTGVFGPVLTFGLDPSASAPNEFNMYTNTTARGNDATGLGFVTGSPILTAKVISATEIFAFTNGVPPFPENCTDPTNPGCLLDPLNLNPSAGPDTIKTLYGLGSITLTLQVTFANPAYFPGLLVNTTFAFTSTDQTLPFRNVAPTDCFFNQGPAACTGLGEFPGWPSVGATNASSGPNTIFESDARTSFTSPSAIPEPVTLMTLGLGLVGTAAVRRRQKKNKK